MSHWIVYNEARVLRSIDVMIRPVYFLLLETSRSPLFSLPLQSSADLIQVKENT